MRAGLGAEHGRDPRGVVAAAATEGKFIIGQRPLSEYDAFLGELEEAGASKLLELLNTRSIAVD